MILEFSGEIIWWCGKYENNLRYQEELPITAMLSIKFQESD